MSSQVFYRKWRPRTLAEVVGQGPVIRTLLNALASGRVSHAYLFCGPRGTGKTSTGRILAKAVNCLTNGKGEPCNTCSICQQITEGRALDVIEIDAASNRGIDEIRDLREKAGYAPNQARHKVYIIDEVHMLTKEASNALLKTLEEPPPHIIFILATTEAHKILPTILSRCQRFDFRRISQADVADKLASICNAEGIRVAPEALRLIAKATSGSLRDAENMLQQLTTCYGADVELKQVQDTLGITGDWRARELIKHIINNDAAAGVKTINSLNNDGLDLSQFNRELVEYLRALLLIKTGSGEAVDLTDDDRKELDDLATRASLPRIVKAIKRFGQLDLSLDKYSTLPLELALVDCALAEPEAKPDREIAPERPTAGPKLATPVSQPRPRETAARPEPTGKPASPAAAASTPAPAAAEFVPPASPSPGSEIERLRLHLRQFLREAPDNIGKTPAAALLRSARHKAIEDNVVVLSFKHTTLKENMEKLENQKIAESIISSFLGRACRVRCIYEAEDNHLVKAALKIGAPIIEGEDK